MYKLTIIHCTIPNLELRTQSYINSILYSIAVWDIASEQAICGSPAALQSAGVTYAIAYANHNDYKFVTGGK